jgi:predicted dehydrogenase
VYAPVITHAEQVAVELGCDVAPGIMALIEREDVRALLVLDTAWYSGAPAQFACQVGKPAYLAGRLVHWLPIANALARRAAETGVTLMPDFGHRYTPATSRLRELIATRIGRPLSMVVDAAAPSGQSPGEVTSLTPLADAARDTLAMAIDWCTNLVGTPPVSVRAAPGGMSDSDLHVEFRRPAAGGDAAVAVIRMTEEKGPAMPQNALDVAPIVCRAQVRCAHGTASLEGSRNVTWESGKERSAESLASDRPDVEVMLDHFTRRVLGGLIPVPTLDDLCRAFQLVDTAIGPS